MVPIAQKPYSCWDGQGVTLESCLTVKRRSCRTSFFTMVTLSSVTTKGGRPERSCRTSFYTMVTLSSVTTKSGRPERSSSITYMNGALNFLIQDVTILYRGDMSPLSRTISWKISEGNFPCNCECKNVITERYSTGSMTAAIATKNERFLTLIFIIALISTGIW